ncbi:MAG: FAD-dependent oxidoreductase, partial [Actinomycetes bacterium]
MTSVVVLGGGPGGYEAALVAAQEGAEVTLIEDVGLGGAAVLTDCVPSKTLVAIARSGSLAAQSAHLGVRIDGHSINPRQVGVDLDVVDRRIEELASAQSQD